MILEDVQIDAPETLSLVATRKDRRLRSNLIFDLLSRGTDSDLRCSATSSERQRCLKLETCVIASGLAQQFAFDLVHNARTFQSCAKKPALRKSDFGTNQTMCPDDEDTRFLTMTDAGMSYTQGRDMSFADGFSFEGRDTSQTSSSAGFSLPGQPWSNDVGSSLSFGSETSKSSNCSMSSESRQVAMKAAMRSLRAMNRKFDRTVFHAPSLASLRKDKSKHGMKLPIFNKGGDGSSPAGANFRVRRHMPFNRKVSCTTPPSFASGPVDFGFPSSSAGSSANTPRRTFESEEVGSVSNYSDSQNGSFVGERHIFSSSTSGVFSGTSSGSVTPQRNSASSSACPAMEGANLVGRAAACEGGDSPLGQAAASSTGASPSGGDHCGFEERTSERGSVLPLRGFLTMPPIRETGDDDTNDSGSVDQDLCLLEFP